MKSNRYRVILINNSDTVGGAAIAARRLQTGLNHYTGFSSRMLVGSKRSQRSDVRQLTPSFVHWAIDQCAGKLGDLLSLQYLTYPYSAVLPLNKWIREAQILNIHNIHGGYLSQWALPMLGHRVPIIWTLHDMWSFTGHCAYTYDCERWRTGCGDCPRIDEYPRLRWDSSHLLWCIRARMYERVGVSLVTPSRWLAEQVRNSPLLTRFRVHCIPNGLDTEVFQPQDQGASRKALGIEQDASVLMFGTQMLGLRRKGRDELLGALKQFSQESDRSVVLLLVGHGDVGSLKGLPQMSTRSVGEVEKENEMAALYSASDVFLLPTLADNLPNVLLESTACGTPAITYDVGGCGEVIRHMETGYLAGYRDSHDFARGIRLLLEHENLRREMGAKARKMVLSEYTLRLQSTRYGELFREQLSRVSRAGFR